MLRSLALSLFVVTAADVAYADPSPYPPCTKAPTQADLDAARALHQAAKQYLAKALYERAIQSWLDAATFDCTKPEVYLNIGGAYERLGDTEKAIAAYKTYIDRKGAAADPDTVEKVKNLKALVANKHQPQGTEGDAKGTDGTPNGGDGSDTPPPSTPPSEGPGLGPWLLTGAGGALALTGVILLGVGSSKVSSAESICPDRNCGAATNLSSAELQAAQDKGNAGLRLERVGGPMTAVGLAAVGGGLAWYFLAQPDAKPAAAPTAGAWQVLPQVGWGYYGASTSVAF